MNYKSAMTAKESDFLIHEDGMKYQAAQHEKPQGLLASIRLYSWGSRLEPSTSMGPSNWEILLPLHLTLK